MSIAVECKRATLAVQESQAFLFVSAKSEP